MTVRTPIHFLMSVSTNSTGHQSVLGFRPMVKLAVALKTVS